MSKTPRLDDAFELLRAAPKGLPRRAWAVAIVVLIGAAWFAAASWSDLRLANLDAAKRLAESRSDAHALQRDASEADSRLAAQRQAILRPRAALAAWLYEIERCHPQEAQVRTLSVDSMEGHASMEAIVAESVSLAEWALCLNEGLPAPAWRVVRIVVEGGGLGRVQLERATVR